MSRRSPLPPGVMTLCVVFICLCMSLLALLSYNSARDQLALAEASAQSTSEVLQAGYNCRLRLAEAQRLLERGEKADDIALETGADLLDNILVFEEPAAQNRLLRAELQLYPRPRLKSFCTIYTGQWNPDTYLDVWDGQ